MTLQVGFLLLFCNIAWAINPAVAKILVQEMGPSLTAWAKYMGAFVCLVIYLCLRVFVHSQNNLGPFLRRRDFGTKNFLLVFVMGTSAFFLAPLAQMMGLQTSSATSNSLLVAIEPLLTLLLAWLILRTRPAAGEAVCLVIAIVGFALIAHLSWSGRYRVSVNSGDLFILGAIGCEALYAVLIQKLKRLPAEWILGASMAVGLFLLSVIVLPQCDMARMASLSTRARVALVWAASLGGVVPYLIWTQVIKKGIPLTVLVSSLFWQPLLGSLAGYVIHGEILTGYQILGGILILGAVALQMLMEKTSRCLPGKQRLESLH